MHGRYHALDYLKVMLVAGVVLGHSGLGQQSVGTIGLLLGSSILRMAVPLFALISGFFLLHSIERGRFRTWVTRILSLYAIWSLFYFLLMQLWERPFGQNLYELSMGLIHLWFLLGLAQAALILSVIRRWGLKVLLWSGLAFGLAGMALQGMRLSGLAPVALEVFRSGPFDLYIFLVMGYAIAEIRRDPTLFAGLRPSNRVLWGMVMGGFVLVNLEQVFWMGLFHTDMAVEMMAGFWLICPAIFLLVLDVPARRPALPLAAMVSAIYMLHMSVLHLGMGMNLLGVTLAAFLVPALGVYALSVTTRGQRLMLQIL